MLSWLYARNGSWILPVICMRLTITQIIIINVSVIINNIIIIIIISSLL